MTIPSFPRARIRVAIILFVLLAPMVVRTLSPPPPPYYEYHIQGTLVRTGGGPVQNYALAVADRPADAWEVLKMGAKPLSITDDEGTFSVIAQAFDAYDSLAVVVLLPGEDPLIAKTFERESVQPTERTEYYTPYHDSDGCCREDPAAVERVAAYVYVYPEMTITVP